MIARCSYWDIWLRQYRPTLSSVHTAQATCQQLHLKLTTAPLLPRRSHYLGISCWGRAQCGMGPSAAWLQALLLAATLGGAAAKIGMDAQPFPAQDTLQVLRNATCRHEHDPHWPDALAKCILVVVLVTIRVYIGACWINKS